MAPLHWGATTSRWHFNRMDSCNLESRVNRADQSWTYVASWHSINSIKFKSFNFTLNCILFEKIVLLSGYHDDHISFKNNFWKNIFFFVFFFKLFFPFIFTVGRSQRSDGPVMRGRTSDGNALSGAVTTLLLLLLLLFDSLRLRLWTVPPTCLSQYFFFSTAL